MFAPKQMTKIELIGPRARAYPLIDLLYKLKLLHIVDHQKSDELDLGAPLGKSELVADLLLKVRGLLSLSSAVMREPLKSLLHTKDRGLTFELIHEKVASLIKQHEALQYQLTETGHQVDAKKQLLDQLEVLHTLSLTVEDCKPYKHLALFLGSINKNNDGDLASHLTAITRKHQLSVVEHHGKKQKLIALFVERAAEENVKALLSKYGFQEIDLSTVMNTPSDSSPSDSSLDNSHDSLSMLRKESQHLLEQHSSFLYSAEAFLSTESEKQSAPLRFAATQQTLIVRGWVPTSTLKALRQGLDRELSGAYHLTTENVDALNTQEKVPVLLQHPALVKPFEFFMYLYTLPKYTELDPTFFLALTFPFFFGMMLGDVGYGFVTLALFLFLRWKIPSGKQLLTAMVYCSLISILFGFAFGEYFGYEHVSEPLGKTLVSWGLPLERVIIHEKVVYDLPRILNRLHSEVDILGNTIPTVLVLGGVLGFLHINLGLLFGFFHELHTHGFFHALAAKGSWFLLQGGLAIVVLSLLEMIALSSWIGYFLIAAAVLLLYKGEGIQGLVELPALLSNMLSYFRLGAVGLASVGLAAVVNESLAGPFLHKGGWFLVLGGVIFIIGHTINIALGIIGPFLHSLRLHYVEFFSKFFHGGGVLFKPFGEEKK